MTSQVDLERPVAGKSAALIAEADRLAGTGRRLDAVDLLQSVDDELIDRGDGRLEQRLVELRRDAVIDLSAVDSGPPPAFDDPFPGRTDLIDISAAEATLDVVGGAITHHGCVLIRNLLAPDVAASLVDDIDRAFEGLHAASAGASHEATAPWYVPLAANPDLPVYSPEERANPRWFRVCVVDAPRPMFRLIRAFDQAGVVRLVTDLLGERPVLTGHKWALRRMPKRKIVGWHQEASVFGSATPLRTINVWTALTECGVHAPGFDVLPRREYEIFPAERGFMLSNDTFDRVRDREPASPVYGPGDAMLFDDHLIHRTNTNDSMDGVRHSIESWFFTRGGMPDDRDAVVL